MYDLMLKNNTVSEKDVTDTPATDLTDADTAESAEELTTLITDAVETTDTADAEAAITEAKTETETATQTSTAKDDGPAGLSATLPLMGKGMVGIFLVTVAIILAVALLNKATTKK